jgi:hypothetical protein
MNEEQQELLGEVYNNYTRLKAHPLDGKYGDTSVRKFNHMYPYEPILSQEEFIDKIKTDPEFSKLQGLAIEERELKYHERRKYRANMIGTNYNQTEDDFYDLDKYNIPTKLITLTYNNETIESYDR